MQKETAEAKQPPRDIVILPESEQSGEVRRRESFTINNLGIRVALTERPAQCNSGGNSGYAEAGPLHRSRHVRLSSFELCPLWVESLEFIPRRHLNNLRQMEGVPIGALRDLFAAAEAVRDD